MMKKFLKQGVIILVIKKDENYYQLFLIECKCIKKRKKK